MWVLIALINLELDNDSWWQSSASLCLESAVACETSLSQLVLHHDSWYWHSHDLVFCRSRHDSDDIFSSNRADLSCPDCLCHLLCHLRKAIKRLCDLRVQINSYTPGLILVHTNKHSNMRCIPQYTHVRSHTNSLELDTMSNCSSVYPHGWGCSFELPHFLPLFSVPVWCVLPQPACLCTHSENSFQIYPWDPAQK